MFSEDTERGHSESTLAQNFKFLFPPLPCLSMFILHVLAPSQRMLALVS